MSIISFNRILLGACHYDRPILQKAFSHHPERHHHGRQGSICECGLTWQRKRSRIYWQKADMIRTVTLPHLELFGISDGLELRVSAGYPTCWEESFIWIPRSRSGVPHLSAVVKSSFCALLSNRQRPSTSSTLERLNGYAVFR
jgi:hypothetical protein